MQQKLVLIWKGAKLKFDFKSVRLAYNRVQFNLNRSLWRKNGVFSLEISDL